MSIPGLFAYSLSIVFLSISPGKSTCWILISLPIEQVKVEMINTLRTLPLLLFLYQAVCKALYVQRIICNYIKIRLSRTPNNHSHLWFSPSLVYWRQLKAVSGQLTIEKDWKLAAGKQLQTSCNQLSKCCSLVTEWLEHSLTKLKERFHLLLRLVCSIYD